MAAFNFPNSPSTNDIHNENGVSWKWNGSVWKKIGTVANTFDQINVTGVSTSVQLNATTVNVTGISTFKAVYVGDDNGSNNNRIRLGASQDLSLWHDGTNSYVANTGGDLFVQTGSAKAVYIRPNNGANGVICHPSGSVSLYHNNVLKFETVSYGVVSKGSVEIQNGSMTTADSSDSGTSNSAIFGTGSDLKVFHDGSNSYIKDTGSGGLRLCSSEFNVKNAANNQVIIRGTESSSVELYHANSKKIETMDSGVNVSGITSSTNLNVTGIATIAQASPTTLNVAGVSTFNDNVNLLDNDQLRFGNGNDINILHSGSSNLIRAYNVPFKIQLNNNHESIVCVQAGEVQLYHNNSKKFETSSTGVSITGIPVATQTTGNVGLELHATGSGRGSQTKYHNDHGEAYVGTAGDTTGNLLIHNTSNTHMLFATNNTERLRINSSGAVSIASNNYGSGHSSAKLRVGTESGSTQGTAIFGTADTTIPAITVTNWDGAQTQNWSVIQFDNSGWGNFQIGGTAGADAFAIWDDGAERLRITSSGQLLVGTTSSSEKVHVQQNHNGHTRIVVQNNWGANATAQLKLISPTDELQIIKYSSGNAAMNLSNSADLYFSTAGTERLRIRSDGKVLIGTSNVPSNKNTVTPSLNVSGNGVLGAAQITRHTSVGGGGALLHLAGTRGGDVNSYTILQDGDGIGTLAFNAADGNEFVVAAEVKAQVDGTPGDNDMPGRLIFATTSDGASSVTERLRIDSGGHIRIGRPEKAVAKGALIIDNEQRNAMSDRSDPDNYGIVLCGSPTSNEGNGIAFTNDNAQNTAAAIIAVDRGSNNLGDLRFYTKDEGSPSGGPKEGFRINQKGSLVGATGGFRNRDDIKVYDTMAMPQWHEGYAVSNDTLSVAASMFHQTHVRGTSHLTTELFSTKMGGNGGMYVQVEVWFSCAVSNLQGYQMLWANANRTSWNNFTINNTGQEGNQLGTDTGNYFNLTYSSSGSGASQRLTWKVTTSFGNNYVRMLYKTTCIGHDYFQELTVIR